MKPPTVFLGEMTNREVEQFLKANHTVIVPVGSTEQHGPHLALTADVLIPQEVARRVAPKVGAVVAPPLSYALSYPHVGFKRVVFLNGHYDNTYAIAYACANAAERLPRDVKAFPINYWDGIPPEVAKEYMSLEKGLHANAAETAAVMAINPALVDMEHANAEFPPFPDFTVESGAVHTAFFFSAPGSVYWATKSGTWGDARQATPQMGEKYLQIAADATLAVLDNIEKTFRAMPPR